MSHLYEVLARRVDKWRADGYPAVDSPPSARSSSGLRAAQLSFAIYRVNDYDLAIQHLEAVELACEHIGVTRTRTDRYFDGTFGKKLVKIVPFNHPLTLLDLEGGEARAGRAARGGSRRGDGEPRQGAGGRRVDRRLEPARAAARSA